MSKIESTLAKVEEMIFKEENIMIPIVEKILEDFKAGKKDNEEF